MQSAELLCRLGAFMTKAMEFRSRAEQYRELAAQFPDQQFRDIIFSMAAMCENLADDRERFLPNRVADHAAIQPVDENVMTEAGNEPATIILQEAPSAQLTKLL